MTMPDRVWASEDVSGASDEWKMAMWHGHQNLIKPVRTPYIRADLADELARALEANDYLATQQERALNRYKEATK